MEWPFLSHLMIKWTISRHKIFFLCILLCLMHLTKSITSFHISGYHLISPRSPIFLILEDRRITDTEHEDLTIKMNKKVANWRISDRRIKDGKTLNKICQTHCIKITLYQPLLSTYKPFILIHFGVINVGTPTWKV